MIKEYLIQYLPSILATGLGAIVAKFLSKANVSFGNLEKVQTNFTNYLYNTYSKTNEKLGSVISSLNDNTTTNADVSAIIAKCLKSLEESTDKNAKLTSAVLELKKDIIELKALARKEDKGE